MRKKSIKKIVDKLPAKFSKIPIIFYFFILYHKDILRLFRLVNSYKGKINTASISKKEERKFLIRLKQYCYWHPQGVAESFINSYLGSDDFRCLQRNIKCNDNDQDAILLCCVKNDIKRIKVLIEHHKSIGVNKFVFVDNMSEDGTLEYLLNIGADVYQTADRYHAGAKAAWCRKVWDVYGYDRWYLVVDSDELFSYIGMEQHTIDKLVYYAEQRHIERVRGLLLDMYSKQAIFSCNDDNENIIKTYSYFDKNSYYSDKDFRCLMMRGGPRHRLFEQDDEFAQPLTKYPLLKVQIFDLWADHIPIPFSKNFKSECFSVLRHYKFLSGDKEKYKKIVKEENYYNGSYSYKRYLDKIESNNDLGFYYEDSVKYESSDSLRAISFIESIFDK